MQCIELQELFCILSLSPYLCLLPLSSVLQLLSRRQLHVPRSCFYWVKLSWEKLIKVNCLREEKRANQWYWIWGIFHRKNSKKHLGRLDEGKHKVYLFYSWVWDVIWAAYQSNVCWFCLSFLGVENFLKCCYKQHIFVFYFTLLYYLDKNG